MNRLLTLLALAGLSATVVACGGDDDGDDGDKPVNNGSPDAAVKDSAVPVREQQIDTDSLADACKDKSECKGKGDVQCLTDLGTGDQPLEGGYCTAQCNYDDECGPQGKCPAAALKSGIIGTLLSAAGAGDLLPQNCLQTCTADDAGGQGSCARSEHFCRTLLPAELLAQVPAMLASALPAQLKLTYCFPEVEINFDGGLGDGGLGAILPRGMDAGR